MTQEEKAKSYDEALERARQIHSKTEFDYEKGMMEEVFPELKESEDERIRKEIIEFVKSRGGFKQEYITWLEKQGKETSWKPSKEEMDVLYGLAYITNQYDEHKEEVIIHLYQDLKREFFNGSSYENMFSTNTSIEDDVRRRSTIQVLEYARNLDTYNQYGKADIDKNIAWLEKQGEQKANYTTIVETGDGGINAVVTEELSTDKVEPKFKVGDKIRRKTPSTFDKDMQVARIEKDYYICNHIGKFSSEVVLFSEQSGYELIEQSCYNIESKFKVGDWIVYNRNDSSREILYVYDIRDGRYYFNDNVHFSWSIKECDEKSHLWSIEDAKDGDVLVDVYGNIGIFEKRYGINWHTYCYLGCKGCFTSEGGSHGSICYPATKEQRDTLMKAMANAGYAFDFEKKELKLLITNGGDFGVQNNEWSEEDYINWLKKQGYFKWGDEDNENMNSLCVLLDQMVSINAIGNEHSIGHKNWLKSIKQRIGE